MAGTRVGRYRSGWVAVLALIAGVACGGGGGSPTTPSPPPTGGGGGTGGGATDQATITITSAGVVAPANVTIRQGGRVTFVNSDSGSHDMASDPHPGHEDCEPMSQVGFLSPGQSRTSGNFTVVQTCGYHDHSQPRNTGLQGRITIVAQ